MAADHRISGRYPAQNAEEKETFEETFTRINDKEKRVFRGCTIASLVLGVFFGFICSMSSGENSFITEIICGIMIGYSFLATLYGAYCSHPFKRFPGLGAFLSKTWWIVIIVPPIGAILLAPICIFSLYIWPMIAFVYSVPKAIIRTLLRKPLLSEGEVIKGIQKGIYE